MNVEISPEVRRGVEWLDTQVSGWENDVDAERTNFLSDNGILEQVFGDHDLIVYGAGRGRRGAQWASKHGFDSVEQGLTARRANLRSLADQWRQVIREHQAQTEDTR